MRVAYASFPGIVAYISDIEVIDAIWRVTPRVYTTKNNRNAYRALLYAELVLGLWSMYNR